MSKLYGGLKSPKQSSLRAVGTVAAATGGGGSSGGWDVARVAALDPDPFWDDVEFLFQPHFSDGVPPTGTSDSTSPDRKTGEDWLVRRNGAGSSTIAQTHGNFSDLVIDPLLPLPLGCGYKKNDYGSIQYQGDHTSLDPDAGDWTMEVVYYHSSNIANHNANIEPFNMPSSAGSYKWGIYNSMANTGSGGVSIYDGVGQRYQGFGSADLNGDYSDRWAPNNTGLQHFCVFHDQSAGKVQFFYNGICGPGLMTGDWSGYNTSAALGMCLFGQIRSSGDTSTEAHNAQGIVCTASRFTMADRYSLTSKMSSFGLPTDYFAEYVFPERGE